jgi:hypothetical protein
MGGYPDVRKENGYYRALGGAVFQRRSDHPYKNSTGFGVRWSVYVAYLILILVFLCPFFPLIGKDYSDNALQYERRLTLSVPITLGVLYLLFYTTYESATIFTDFDTLVKRGANKSLSSYSGPDVTDAIIRGIGGPNRSGIRPAY